MHFEIGCRDSSRAQKFFSELFGWTVEQVGPASMINTGSDLGIGGHISSLGHEPHHYVTVYAQVEDIPETLKKAESLGGSTVIAETEVPDQGSFAWFKDLDQNIVGLWKPFKR